MNIWHEVTNIGLSALNIGSKLYSTPAPHRIAPEIIDTTPWLAQVHDQK